MCHRITEYLIAPVHRLKLSSRDVLPAEEELCTFIEDRLRARALVPRTITILEEDSRPIVEVIVCIVGEDA